MPGRRSYLARRIAAKMEAEREKRGWDYGRAAASLNDAQHHLRPELRTHVTPATYGQWERAAQSRGLGQAETQTSRDVPLDLIPILALVYGHDLYWWLDMPEPSGVSVGAMDLARAYDGERDEQMRRRARNAFYAVIAHENGGQ